MSRLQAGPVSAARAVRTTVAVAAMLSGLLRAPLPAAADEAPRAPGAVWPLTPRPEVVAHFSPPSSPWGPGHRGADLAGAVGSPVRAAMAGRVTYAGRLAGRGVVSIRHDDGSRTTYEPVSATVSGGARVATGQRVGWLQLLGSHCFPRACLHWGLISAGDYRDPLTLVGAGPVRLLPWDGLTRMPATPGQVWTDWMRGLLDRQAAVADSSGVVSPSPTRYR